MYKIILTLTVLFFITEVIEKEMKVLIIGNSFSICVGNNLPQIVVVELAAECEGESSCF